MKFYIKLNMNMTKSLTDSGKTKKGLCKYSPGNDKKWFTKRLL